MTIERFPIIPALAVLVFAGFGLYRFILYPAFLSPLSKIPDAHWSASFSQLWILYHRHNQNDTLAVHDAHTRLGCIVRIAPNEISINSVEGGIRSVYSAGFEKGGWYQNAFTNYGTEPMFAMPDHARHAKRKRMISHIYAKSVLLGSDAMAGISRIVAGERLRQRIRDDMASSTIDAEGDKQDVIEFYTIFAAVATDLVAAYVFGLRNGSNMLRDQERSKAFLTDYKARQRYTFWPQECPVLMKTLGSVGLRWVLVPKWVDRANASIETWIMSMCERAEKSMPQSIVTKPTDQATTSVPEDFPSVYTQLRSTLLKEHESGAQKSGVAEPALRSPLKIELASELLDHTLAGFDTSSITLVYLAWELSRSHNRHWQTTLREELRNLPSELRLDLKSLDTLPVLHAVIMETLRLHAAIPGQQPRHTPPNPSSPTILAGYEVPADVRVQAQAWSLHREISVFPDPEKFDPARWIDVPAERSKEMGRWFWAFSSGGRMCVGSNLAMMNMKVTVASIWSAFETEVVGDGRVTEKLMVHNGGYIAEPKGDGFGRYCRLRVREVSDHL